MARNSIEISKLRNVIDDILLFIEQNSGKEVIVDFDYYREFGVPDMFRINPAENVEFGVGSLSDDWDFVRSADRESALPLLLTHVAPILQALAATVQNWPDQH